MSTTRWERVMTQEQLMKVKIKYLEDRITTMEKSLSRINYILAHMTESQEQGFKDVDTMLKEHELI